MKYRGSAHSRGYDHHWQKARRQYLLTHPVCVYCKKQGKLTPATVVDHIIPHQGDQRLFWDTENWQSLCKLHHDSAKKREEKKGHMIGCEANGTPLDPLHHWNVG